MKPRPVRLQNDMLQGFICSTVRCGRPVSNQPWSRFICAGALGAPRFICAGALGAPKVQGAVGLEERYCLEPSSNGTITPFSLRCSRAWACSRKCTRPQADQAAQGHLHLALPKRRRLRASFPKRGRNPRQFTKEKSAKRKRRFLSASSGQRWMMFQLKKREEKKKKKMVAFRHSHSGQTRLSRPSPSPHGASPGPSQHPVCRLACRPMLFINPDMPFPVQIGQVHFRGPQVIIEVPPSSHWRKLK